MSSRLRLRAFLCLGLIAPALTACDDSDDFARLPETEEQDLTDGEIVAVVVAINGGEIEQGELARTTAERGDVRAYGERMVVEHADATVRLGDLMADREITLVENDLSREVSSDALSALARLETVGDDAFDRHYVAVQLQMHATALSLLRDRLIPEAEDDALVAELEAMEAAVELHLDEARDLAIEMGGGETPDDGNDDDVAGGDVGL
jgi:predicted outer membrane protein